MRTLSHNERRLLVIVGVLGFALLNFWGYNALSSRRTLALAQQRTLRNDIFRLEQLRNEKASAEINRDWIASRLPAYTDVDQLETHLYRAIAARAADPNLGIELTKEDPRPTQKDEFVHRSIVDIEFTDDIESVIGFLHAIQEQEAFRFISHLELQAQKDPQKIRCIARIEQWWRADSEAVTGAIADTADASSSTPAPATSETPSPAGGSSASGESPQGTRQPIEQIDATAVKTAASETSAALPAGPPNLESPKP
jgi:hypothetical protein